MWKGGRFECGQAGDLGSFDEGRALAFRVDDAARMHMREAASTPSVDARGCESEPKPGVLIREESYPVPRDHAGTRRRPGHVGPCPASSAHYLRSGHV